jgi:Fe-S-cluster containining protein
MSEFKCRRCGTCCIKGGPVLHREDLDLVRSGAIAKTDLVCLRKGETALDPVKNELIRLEGEMLKIKGQGDSWTCLYFISEPAGCQVYSRRPLECRVLSCVQPELLKKVYARDRLTRFDLVGPKSGMGQIISEHERTCSWKEVNELLGRWTADRADRKVLRALLGVCQHDLSLRNSLAEMVNMDPDDLQVYLGRPIWRCLGAHDSWFRTSGFSELLGVG